MSGHLTREAFEAFVQKMLEPPRLRPREFEFIGSLRQCYEIQLLERPNDPRAPEWREWLRRDHVRWMKDRMRGRCWPWAAGPKGRLP